MKWFEHPADFRDTPELKEMRRCSGIVGYGCACMVLEILAQRRKSQGDPFELSLDDKRFGLSFWKEELQLADRGAAMRVLLTLAGCSVIDQEALEQRRVVYAPMLQNMMDAWSKRKSGRET